MKRLIVAAAALLGACVSIEVSESVHSDPTLAAIMAATPRTCPPGDASAAPPAEAGLTTVGVSAGDIALTPLASDATRAVRLRRLMIAPGGSVGWHDHRSVQGMAMIVSGEAVEYRVGCARPMTYRAGDVAIEDAGTEHAWRNVSAAPVVIVTAQVVAR